VKTTLIKLRLIAYKHYTRFVHDRVLPNLPPSCPVLLSPMDGTLSIGIVKTGKDGTDGATDSAHAQIVISLTPTSTLRPQNGTLYAASVAGNSAGGPPAVLSSVSSYNTLGQLIRTSEYSSLSASAPLRENLFSYDPLGNATLTAQDLNLNGVIDLAGPDRVSSNATEFVQIDGDWFGESRSYTFPEGNSATALLTGLQRTRLTGLGLNSEFGIQNSEFIFQDLLGNQTLSRTFIDRDHAVLVGLVSTPDSTNAATQVSVNGLAQYSISQTGVRIDYAYDALGRQISARVDAASPPRSVGSVTHYNSLGQVDWVADALTNRTTFTYCPTTGRRIAVTDALSNTVHTAYDPEGRVIATWGATYPVRYSFDDYGRMTAMGTYRGTNEISAFQDFSFSAIDKTEWLYDQPTGLLTNKVYADGKGPSYTYTPQGQFATRKWARGVQTTYSYTNTTGELIGIDYSDATPDVTFAFNRIGQPITITDGTGTRAFAYNDALQLAAETNAFGVLARAYDGLGRSAGFSLFNPANPVNPVQSIAYGYSALGRFSQVSNFQFQVSYSYLPGTDLLSGWTSPSGFAVTRAFEAHRDLLTAVSNRYNGVTVSAFDYINDAIARRTQRIDTGSAASTNQFGYNPRSELTNATMGTNQFGYAYDPIGNRQLASANASTNRYAANALNQYTNITAGTVQVPQYDLDGNLTNYNGWTYAWDGENRLTGVSSNGTPIASYRYDYMSRRVQKIVGATTNTFQYDGWAMVREITTGETNSYVYGLDLSGSMQGAGTIGGLMAVVRNGQPYYPVADANGNITDYIDINGAVVAHYEFDAFGNTAVQSGTLADAFAYRFSTKYLDAETRMYYYGYRYLWNGRWINRDPLGDHVSPGARELHGKIAAQMGMAVSWSLSIAQDENADPLLRLAALSKALYWLEGIRVLRSGDPSFSLRWYDPVTGRWLSNDPIGIAGGLNQYVFCGNDPVNYSDPDGQNPIVVAVVLLLLAGAEYAVAPENEEQACNPAYAGGQGTATMFMSGAIMFGTGVAINGVTKVVGNMAAESGGGLVHLTDDAAAAQIRATSQLRGNIYAGPAANAELSGASLTWRTGLAPGNYQAIPIPAAGEAAFSRPVPIGPFTAWQRGTGQQFTPRGIMDNNTGAFTRQGVNWNQVGWYATDAAIWGGAGAGLYLGTRDE
jgi:RHS repeat-associated protein